jgi:hypothetical protein
VPVLFAAVAVAVVVPVAGGDVVVGGVVVVGDVVTGGVVVVVTGGDVVSVGDFVGVADFFGVGDFDGEAFPVVGSTIMPGPPPPTVLTGCETVADESFLGAADCECVWGGAVVLCPMCAELLPLLEISTAIIATTPMAAAPIPATRKVRDPPDPPPRGGGIRWASF